MHLGQGFKQVDFQKTNKEHSADAFQILGHYQQQNNRYAVKILMEFSNNIQNNRENLNNNNNSLKIERIRNGVIKPKEPRENGTMGGTGPLNIDAACTSER